MNELEIRAFKEEAYYLVFADFKDFKAAYEKNGVNQKDKDLALKVVEKAGKDFIVKEIITEETERFSSFPYTTSKLQQDGIRKLSMSATYVMSTAQKLYEGVQIGDEVIGLITYMRTDSTDISPLFVVETKKVY